MDKIGYSSIIEGARSGGTSTPRKMLLRTDKVGDRFAALLPMILEAYVSPHFDQCFEQSRACRIYSDIFDLNCSSRNQGRDDRKRS